MVRHNSAICLFRSFNIKILIPRCFNLSKPFFMYFTSEGFEIPLLITYFLYVHIINDIFFFFILKLVSLLWHSMYPPPNLQMDQPSSLCINVLIIF